MSSACCVVGAAGAGAAAADSAWPGALDGKACEPPRLMFRKRLQGKVENVKYELYRLHRCTTQRDFRFSHAFFQTKNHL